MDVLSTIVRYCNYQERCHKEVRTKLYELGCNTQEVEQHLVTVIEKGLLNEQRYATAAARGKFKLRQWGRIKIVHWLKANGISQYCIKKALEEINPEEYYRSLIKLAERKALDLRSEKSPLQRKIKTYRYLLQKGYEVRLINEAMDEILEKTR